MPEHRPAVSRETAFPPPGRMSRELGAPPGPGSRPDGARPGQAPDQVLAARAPACTLSFSLLRFFIDFFFSERGREREAGRERVRKRRI